MKDFLRICIMIAAGIFGGFAGSLLFHVSPLMASEKGSEHQAMESLTILNSEGKRAGIVGYGGNGQGVVFLFNHDGKITSQIGSYSNFRDKGQALVAVHDKNEGLRGILRVMGPHDSPALILRDMYGKDKIVIGLEGRTEEPYIKFYDNNGKVFELSPKKFK